MFVSRSLANRDPALDSFRGLMVLGMVLVNHTPPTTAIYPPLVHASWHGWTMADTIFPGFLFAMGVSISLALTDAGGSAKATDCAITHKVIRRVVVLMVLNVLLINFPYYFVGTLVFTGTLSWIAWSYLAASVVALRTGWRVQAGLVLALLAVQWCAYAFLPLTSASPGTMRPDANAAREIDRLLLEPLFGAAWKQENEYVLLPLLGAVASTLIGVLVGQWTRRRSPSGAEVSACFAVGVMLCLAGAAWHSLFPINKALWTASYVVMMAGISMQLYAGLRWVCVGTRGRSWVQPIRIVGVNALFFYVFAQSLQRLLVYGRVSGTDGVPVRLRVHLYETYVVPWFPGELGALLFALAFVLICYATVALLYARRVFVRL